MGALIVAGQPRLHVVPLARWRDGSLKHCAIVGVWSPVAGDNMLLLQPGTPPTNALVPPALPSDVVTLGNAKIALTQAALHRTWFATPDMIERHYRAKSGTRYVWWYVRQWSNGSAWIGRKVENNRSPDGGIGGRSGSDPATPLNDIVSLGGFTNVLPHAPNSGYFVESWVSGADPGTTYLHDPLALSKSMMVPNWIRRPNGWDEDNTNAYSVNYVGTYSPLIKGSHSTDWSTGGFKQQLGLISTWESVQAKYADARGMSWGKVNALAINTYAVCIRDALTHDPPLLSTMGLRDSNTYQVGTTTATGSTVIWDNNHNVNSGYVPYLLTGDFRFWETMAEHCGAIAYFTSNANGNSVNRALTNGEARGCAWMLRTFGQMVGVAPEAMGDARINAFVREYRGCLTFNVGVWLAAGTQDLRAPGLYSATHPGNSLGVAFGSTIDGRRIGVFQYSAYWIWTVAQLLDIDATNDRAASLAFLQFLGRCPVGMLDIGGPGAFCWDQVMIDVLGDGGYLRVTSAPDESNSMRNAFKTWGDVYVENFGAWRTPGPMMIPDGTQTISGETSYLTGGNWVMHSISACVDYGVAGAKEAFDRVVGASNFSQFGGDNKVLQETYWGWGATPTEGIVPRSWIDGKPNSASALTSSTSRAMFVAIPGSSPSLLAAMGVPSDAIDAYSGLATDQETGCIYSVAGGGHAAGDWNYVLKCDLREERPKWVILKNSSGSSTVRSAPYWPDGRPTGAHNYYFCHVINVNGRKGLLRVLNTYGSFSGAAPLHTDCFWLDTNEWDLNGAGWPAPYQAAGNDFDTAMCCMDPRTQLIYVGCRQGAFSMLDPINRVWKALQSNGWGMAFGGSVVVPDTGQVVYDYGAFRVGSAADAQHYSGKIWATFPVGGGPHTERPLQWSTATPPLRTADALWASQESGLAYDSSGKKIYWISGKYLVRVDPFSWEAQWIGEVPQAFTNVYNRFGYVPALNALYYLPRFSAEVMILANPGSV